MWGSACTAATRTSPLESSMRPTTALMARTSPISATRASAGTATILTSWRLSTTRSKASSTASLSPRRPTSPNARVAETRMSQIFFKPMRERTSCMARGSPFGTTCPSVHAAATRTSSFGSSRSTPRLRTSMSLPRSGTTRESVRIAASRMVGSRSTNCSARVSPARPPASVPSSRNWRKASKRARGSFALRYLTAVRAISSLVSVTSSSGSACCCGCTGLQVLWFVPPDVREVMSLLGMCVSEEAALRSEAGVRSEKLSSESWSCQSSSGPSSTDAREVGRHMARWAGERTTPPL
mmetsp:Transcript_5367/g.14958  ORF Transcript_5367/g.14958 Transcript_5367/m.14958 type:complete len:296 (-) Transcript_5367:19-906(-)